MTESQDRQATYADGDKYQLPNDSVEQSRLEAQDRALYTLLGRRKILSDISKPRTIVDIGCGTGTTTIALALANIESQVIGVDLSPVPDLHVNPPNVTWIQGDIRELAGKHELLQEGSVDFAFNRLLMCGMTDWPGYVDIIMKLVRPGGWVEMQDGAYIWYGKDGNVLSGEGWEWLDMIKEQGAAKGMDMDCGIHLSSYLEKSGFVDVQVDRFKWPWGLWLKEEQPETERIGAIWKSILALDHKLVGKMLAGKYPEDEIKQVQEQSSKVLGDEGLHKYKILHVARGRKPS